MYVYILNESARLSRGSITRKFADLLDYTVDKLRGEDVVKVISISDPF